MGEDSRLLNIRLSGGDDHYYRGWEKTKMFRLNRSTGIIDNILSTPVKNAVSILRRDMDKILMSHDQEENEIVLQVRKEAEDLQKNIAETYEIVISDTQIIISASDDLGFIYGMLRISKDYLGVKPFWFWMDQKMEQTDYVEIPAAILKSPVYKVRFRGWFFNDEVLMLKWAYNKENRAGWRMCFEALLRCGGNMTIPGTDKISRANRKMAADMGLWITHHHAEPLGAEMFIRAYPDLEPNYFEHADLFQKLWEDAVIEQKDYNVVWNLCFRGQGDAPFWSCDTTGQFDTPEKQGKMISDLIRTQKEIVKKYVKNPVFCTNLYGEIMELYREGYVDIDEDVIKVRADNGFGKMVTRRRDDHCVRISSMPEKNAGAQGIYYHVSFYDLQAANHITMLPNSVSFVNRELDDVLENDGNAFWVINCSNVRPHAYYLDAVSKKWGGREIDDKIQSEEFTGDYFQNQQQIARCFEDYPKSMIPYGPNEDDHCGEQFYTENIRIMAHQLLAGKDLVPSEPQNHQKEKQGADALIWIAGNKSLTDQIRTVCGICHRGLLKLEEYYIKNEEQLNNSKNSEQKQLFGTTLFLQTEIHYFCAKGVVRFGEAYEAYLNKDFETAFVLFGRSAECFDYVRKQMIRSEYGVWKDFYLNDCFADVEHTAYMVKKVMGYIRELGDNVRHDQWYHEFCCAKEDRGVYLLLVTDNHMTDWELFEVMKNKIKTNKRGLSNE
ncbi:MAG: glycosyl hydrolase 115 family protein [Lachnospiraceae bacterium]|nr:glycosyl hydrolase 115 family protein [Lachnospiraceae bacterium]